MNADRIVLFKSTVSPNTLHSSIWLCWIEYILFSADCHVFYLFWLASAVFLNKLEFSLWQTKRSKQNSKTLSLSVRFYSFLHVCHTAKGLRSWFHLGLFFNVNRRHFFLHCVAQLPRSNFLLNDRSVNDKYIDHTFFFSVPFWITPISLESMCHLSISAQLKWSYISYCTFWHSSISRFLFFSRKLPCYD